MEEGRDGGSPGPRQRHLTLGRGGVPSLFVTNSQRQHIEAETDYVKTLVENFFCKLIGHTDSECIGY